MKISLPFLLLLVSLSSIAQTHHVTGRLVDQQQQSIGFAGIALFKSPDSAHITTVISDSSGYFKLSSLPKGKYWLKASFIGYQDFKSDLFELSENHPVFSFGQIKLVENSQFLKTVEISGARPLLEQRSDRMILNVENSILSTGSTALELLGKAPGVTVDDNGAVSLKGRPGTEVMINGKLTYLSGTQLANLLRGTSSNTISRIEIMANPSSRYDASGKGGLINIVMKKNIKTGFNGTVSGNGGAGRGARFGGGTNLNYRSDIINLFGSYNYFFENLKSYGQQDREFFKDGLIYQRSAQATEEKARLRSQNFRVGLDIFLNEKNTLGFLVNGGIGKYPAAQVTQNLFYQYPSQQLIWDANTLTDDRERWKDLLYNINYVHRFDDKGHELTVDLDYVDHFSRMNQQLNTRYLDGNGQELRPLTSRAGNIPSQNHIYVAKLDYALPLGKSGKLEAGWKASAVRTENNLNYDTLKNNIYVADLSASNHFKYKEDIQAGYVNLKKTYGKFGFQLGLRGEYTATQGHQILTDSIVKRSYFKLFPSVVLNQEINESHKIQLGYGKRIQRPGYWDLNPFRVYTDPFSYEEGNPYLKPAIVNAFEFGYSLQSKYHAVLTYNRTKDVISSIVGVADRNQNVTFLKPENLAVFTNYGISLTGTVDFTSWWSGTQFVNLFRNVFTIQDPQLQTDFKKTSLTFDSQHTFKLAQNWTAELNGLYRSAEISGVFETKAYYMISAGAKKELMQGKANIGLRVNDIFKSKQIKQSARYHGISTVGFERPDSRSVVLSFSYRFGGESAAARVRTTGAEELKGRL